MKQRDRLLFGVLILAMCMRPRAGGAATPQLPEPSGGGGLDTEPDERMLQPGVYWYCCSPAEAPEFLRWCNDRTLIISHVTLLGSNGADCAVVLFETNGVVYWTLTGLPALAPNGLQTTLDQLKREPGLEDFFRTRARQAIEAIKRMDAKVQEWMNQVFNR